MNSENIDFINLKNIDFIGSDKKIPNLIINVLLSVALASTFIGIFFFTYAKDIERQIVVQNVEYTVDDLIGTLVSIFPENIKKVLTVLMNNVKLPDMTSADNEVKENNNNLLIKAGKVLGGILVTSLVVSYIISVKYDLNFGEIITKNLILLCGIALVEFCFLKFIAAKFISANPNIVKKKLLEVIKEKN